MEAREVALCGVRATCTAWLTLALLVLTLVTYVAALATPAWGDTRIAGGAAHVTSGLWRRCARYDGREDCRSLVGSDGVSDMFVTAQCVSVLALAAAILALLAAAAYAAARGFRRDERVALLLAVLSYLSGAFIVITCITFTLGEERDVGATLPDTDVEATFGMLYSFGLAVFASMMGVASGGLATFELFTNKHMIPR